MTHRCTASAGSVLVSKCDVNSTRHDINTPGIETLQQHDTSGYRADHREDSSLHFEELKRDCSVIQLDGANPPASVDRMEVESLIHTTKGSRHRAGRRAEPLAPVRAVTAVEDVSYAVMPIHDGMIRVTQKTALSPCFPVGATRTAVLEATPYEMGQRGKHDPR